MGPKLCPVNACGNLPACQTGLPSPTSYTSLLLLGAEGTSNHCWKTLPSALAERSAPDSAHTVAAIIEAAFHSVGWSLCSQPLGSKRGCPVAARAQVGAWAHTLGHFLLAPPPPGVLSSQQVKGRLRGAGRQPFQLHLASALTSGHPS